MPNLFKKECRKRQEFCETHGIEFKLPRFKSKQGKTSFLFQILTEFFTKKTHVQPIHDTQPNSNFWKRIYLGYKPGIEMINTKEESSTEEEEDEEDEVYVSYQ